MYLCNHSGAVPLVIRKRKDNQYIIKKSLSKTMLFRIKPIQPYINNKKTINPRTNPMYVALHNILCKLIVDDNEELCDIVKTMHNPSKKLFWSVSLKNGFINYKNSIYRNMEDYHFIRMIYKSLFNAIIKLKVILHRIRMKKIKRRLFLIGTQQCQSILKCMQYNINSLIRKRIYQYL